MMTKLQNLAKILRKKSLQLNLFSAGDREKLEEKHIPDSLAVLDFCELSGKVLDIGTGGGLPGLALAVSCPGTEFVLMDAREKKIRVVKEMIEELGLKNALGAAGRFEDLAHEEEFREEFDFVVARAVAALPVLLEYAAGFLNVGGVLFAWKSRDWEESGSAEEELGMKFIEAFDYELPGGEERSILKFEKTKELDEKYPRRTGVPKARPL